MPELQLLAYSGFSELTQLPQYWRVFPCIISIAYCYLIIASPVVIREHPRNMYVLRGSQVTFNCQATSDGDITYLWQRVDNGSELDLSRTSGINSNELIISNISPDDAGSYVCIASNKNEQTKSRKAILDVQGLCYFIL